MCTEPMGWRWLGSEYHKSQFKSFMNIFNSFRGCGMETTTYFVYLHWLFNLSLSLCLYQVLPSSSFCFFFYQQHSVTWNPEAMGWNTPAILKYCFKDKCWRLTFSSRSSGWGRQSQWPSRRGCGPPCQTGRAGGCCLFGTLRYLSE